MIFSSRGIALLLAGGIASIATALLFLFQRVTANVLTAIFVITFFSAFALIALMLESLIFRRIKKLGRIVDRVSGKEREEDGKENGRRNPLEAITDEVRAFADRTEKEIEEHKKLEAFRREFIADVSHELKTPIFAAQGFVHTLLDGAMKDKTVREKFLRKAAKSLDGLDMLVQDLLTLSQLETGQIRMHITEVDLVELTREVFEQFEGKHKKRVELRIEQPAAKMMVYSDAQRIAQVLTNLISNAIKHSPDGQEVVVRFREKKKWVVTSVIDSGEGIAEEHLPRIFERFYRIDKSRSREKGGTGLGLAIVKHILEGHRSKPNVQSLPGVGSTFSFRLRRVKGEKSKNGEDSKPAEEQDADS